MPRFWTSAVFAFAIAALPQVGQAGEPLPPDAQQVLENIDREASEVRKKAEQQLAELRSQAIASLQELQDKYTREAKLDEAVAIRDQIRALKRVTHVFVGSHLPEAPARLYNFQNRIGETFYFRLKARSTGGTVWGTDVVTGDSDVSAAAIHAGILTPGESALIRIDILPGQDSYEGTTKNGITTLSYGPYPFSYRICRATGLMLGSEPPPPVPVQVITPGYGHWRSPIFVEDRVPYVNPTRPD